MPKFSFLGDLSLLKKSVLSVYYLLKNFPLLVCLLQTNNTAVGLQADATVKPSIAWTILSASPDILFKHVFNATTSGHTYKIIGPPGTLALSDSRLSHRYKVHQCCKRLPQCISDVLVAVWCNCPFSKGTGRKKRVKAINSSPLVSLFSSVYIKILVAAWQKYKATKWKSHWAFLA